MKNWIRRFIREEEAQDLVEYAFLIAFIALAAIAILGQTSSAVNNLFSAVNTGVTGS